eukprot:Pgem_evm1s5651
MEQCLKAICVDNRQEDQHDSLDDIIRKLVFSSTKQDVLKIEMISQLETLLNNNVST